MLKLTKEQFTWNMKLIGAILSLVYLLKEKGVISEKDLKKYDDIICSISNDLDILIK